MTSPVARPFDLATAPLSGVNLIEAGAGTGKTYTITGLYLRLILERALPVDRILVVTFTRAATEELRDRIRGRLREALTTLDSAGRLEAVIKPCTATERQRCRSMRLLENAIRHFDMAAVSTIHGLCQRLLQENVFETDSLFDTELVSDSADMLSAVAEDFWRRRFYQLDDEPAAYLMQHSGGPDYFKQLALQALRPGIRVIPDVSAPPVLTFLQPFRRALQKLRAAWPVHRETVAALMMQPALHSGVYGNFKPDPLDPSMTGRQSKVAFLLNGMDRLLQIESGAFPLPKHFECFTAGKLEQCTRKGMPTPSHTVFDLCAAVQTAAQGLEAELAVMFVHLKRQFLAYAQQALAAYKEKRNLQAYDDLLVRVRSALAADRGKPLIRRIQRQYKAALVDEFQDTDLVQYDIFRRLFSSSDHLLFMIGDPKQAIYSFRGADVFSYMKAAAEAPRKYTLLTNYRSRPDLLRAVNTIYAARSRPFFFNAIPFERARPPDEAAAGGSSSGAPLQLWFVGSKDGRPMGVEAAVGRIAAAVAGEVGRLVAAEAVQAHDIGILVRTNQQADIMKTHLFENGIPAVAYSVKNIFDTHEAAEMHQLLLGISEPLNERRLKAALVTDMMGVTARELAVAEEGGVAWRRRLVRCMEYHRMWRRQGFMPMFRRLMKRENVRPRLLSFNDGERRLTNLIHLSEILHKQSIGLHLGVAALVRWLAVQRDPKTPRMEADQLRLESDADAVTITTIHRSKGLEYPVVFCPFAWGASWVKDDAVMFHAPGPDRCLTVDVGSAAYADNRLRAANERLSENLRLLYVALTRAVRRCYLVWGRINTTDTAAMAYLMHFMEPLPEDDAKTDVLKAVQQCIKGKTDADLWQDLTNLATASKGTIALKMLPREASEPFSPAVREKDRALVFKPFTGRIDRSWRISSYSSLISGRAADHEYPERDDPGIRAATAASGVYAAPADDASGTDVPGPDDTVVSFPRGAAAGLFFHALLEEVNFAGMKGLDLRRRTGRMLAVHGFSNAWQPAVAAMIERLAAIPLANPMHTFALSSVPESDRVNEMEFYFPLKRITPAALADCFRDHLDRAACSAFAEQLDQLAFPATEGFMKGYIDLVLEAGGRFFLIDWKSNYLGPRPGDYGPDSLREEMRRSYYYLQYHLYALALHLFLRLKKPEYRYEDHMGGVFYIFLRGVAAGGDPPCGVFYDRPDPALMNRLEKRLVSSEQV